MKGFHQLLFFGLYLQKITNMETLIIHLDKTVSKSKVKEALKMVKGIVSVSEKLTRSDGTSP